MRSFLSMKQFYKLIYIGFFFQYTPNAEPIDTLFAYRNELASLTQPCSFKGIVNKRIGEVDCAHLFELLRAAKNWDKKQWIEEEYKIVKKVLALGAKSAYLHKIPGTIINSDPLVSCYAIILSYGDKFGTWLPLEAFSYLLDFTPYSLLEKHGESIRHFLPASPVPDEQKERLVALTKPPAGIRDTLIKSSMLPRPYKARLGDTIAQKSIIDDFAKADFIQAWNLTKELSICGSKECLKTLAAAFGDTNYFVKNETGKIVRTIRPAIVNAFQKYYPSDTLFNQMYDKLTGRVLHFNDDLTDTMVVYPYVRAVAQFLEKEYDVTFDEASMKKPVFSRE